MSNNRLTDIQKQEYETLFKELLEAYRNNPELPLAVFCRERSIETRSFTSWMNIYKKLTPMQVRNDIRRSLGLKEVKYRGSQEYEKHLRAYRDMLGIDPDYTLAQYCTDVDISQHSFHHWLMRQNLSVEKLRKEVFTSLGLDKISEGEATSPCVHLKPSEPRIFRKALSGYKKMLESNNNLTLQEYCRCKGYAYRPLLHWMREIGITSADIRSFVLDRQKLPKDNRRVFIQFKPNGGTQGDLLKGVRICLPDGTHIEVECCTVVGLCSFVNIYSKQGGD